MKGFKDIDLKLCHSCGTCAGVCPKNAIAIEKELPCLTKECVVCGLCYAACPGREFIYPEFGHWLFGSEIPDGEIGYYRSIYTGYSFNSVIRQRGASGGVVTAILSGLLRSGEISAAVVVSMDNAQPWLPRINIAKTEEELLQAAQSKYRVIPVNSVLSRLRHIEGNVAFVGLPCHIHGLRKLQLLGWKEAKKITYCIGIFCGFNMKAEATDFLIQKMKVKKDDIESLEYRGGSWPGGFLVTTKKKKSYFVEKHFYNYLNLMFVPERCLVCPDLTNEFADISIGDAWGGGSKRQGYSTILVRTQKGEELITSISARGDILLEPSDKNNVIKGHAHLIAYKKKGVFLRQKLSGLTPDFRLCESNLSFKERLFNFLFYYLILLMKTSFMVSFFRHIPIYFPGIIAKCTRMVLNFILHKKNGARKKDDSISQRIKLEYKYLRIKNWSFSDVGAHWDSVEDYDDINNETYSYFRRFIDGYRLSSLRDKSYVLDICCRTGNGTAFFYDKGKVAKAVCADFSKTMQTVCHKRLDKFGIRHEQRLIESLPLPFRTHEFDAVLCFETVEHVPDPASFLNEISRVIRFGGQAIITTPNVLWRPIHSIAAIFKLHHSEGPCRFIGREELRKYINGAGLDIIIERTTVLIPMGPMFLLKAGEYLEKMIDKRLMSIFGLRQVFICKRREDESNTD